MKCRSRIKAQNRLQTWQGPRFEREDVPGTGWQNPFPTDLLRPSEFGTVDATMPISGYYHHAGSGLELAKYRAYDPKLGRFISEDPLGLAGGLNLYGYVGNNPLNMVDPLGDIGINADGSWNIGFEDLLDLERARWQGMAAFIDGASPFGDPLASAGAYNKCDSGFDFSKGAGAFTRNMWAAYGGARLASAIAPMGGSASVLIGTGSPFHVAYGAAARGGATTWVHAGGHQLGNLTVTTRGAAGFVDMHSKITITGIPVLNAAAVIQTRQKAATCFGAAAAGIARGWWPF